jgi:hypothetical protein
MKKTIILFAAAVLALTTTAMAGVVVDQEVSSDGPMGATSSKRTLEIQGHKQKVVSSNHSVITDLDNGIMILVDPKNKTYTEMPFPPTQFGGHQSPAAFKITFKKTGVQKTEKGYRCEEYVGTGHMMMGDYTITGCFTKEAPGAAEYTAFDQTLASKLKGTAMETEGARPEGVPLVLNSLTKMDPSTMPGLTPERAKMIANHPNMTSTTHTTNVKVADLPADTFTVPSGYTKRELPKQTAPSTHPMPPGHPPVGNAPKVPE